MGCVKFGFDGSSYGMVDEKAVYWQFRRVSSSYEFQCSGQSAPTIYRLGSVCLTHSSLTFADWQQYNCPEMFDDGFRERIFSHMRIDEIFNVQNCFETKTDGNKYKSAYSFFKIFLLLTIAQCIFFLSFWIFLVFFA